MPHLFDCTSFPKLKGSKLVIPAISIGNIPQLTIDLLIHTYGFERFAILNEMFLHPFSSPIDTAAQATGTQNYSTDVSNPLEVYYSSKYHTTIVQQRSPIIKGFTDLFIKEDMLRFALAIAPSKVVFLDSSDAGLLENFDCKIDVFVNEDVLSRSLESLKISQATQTRSLVESEYTYSKYIQKFIAALEPSKQDVVVFVSHVYEGDNFNDAETAAVEVSTYLFGSVASEWVRPVSWLGAYGDKPVPNAMEQGLFG